jgi:hypothetical protein
MMPQGKLPGWAATSRDDNEGTIMREVMWKFRTEGDLRTSTELSMGPPPRKAQQS